MCIYILKCNIYKTVISSRENVFILQTALPYLCIILYIFIIVKIIEVFLIVMILESVWHLLEATKKYDSSFKCLESILMRILLVYCKKQKQKQKKQKKPQRNKKRKKKEERERERESEKKDKSKVNTKN